MATQLKHTDFASTTALTPRPNIRVVFTAGDAALAVRGAAAERPAAAATLEELAIGDQAEAVIAQARLLLTPAIYVRFLQWGACASRFSTRYDDDDQGNALCSASADAIHAVADADAINVHDIAFKAWLLILEAADAPGFGPLHYDLRRGGTLCEGIAAGLHQDVSRASPLLSAIEQLSIAAEKFSGSASAWDPSIGNAITVAFERAIAACTAGSGNFGDTWDVALAGYLKARAASEQHPVDDDLEGDRLVDAYCVAMDHLIIDVPAPSAAALNYKMSLVKERQDGFELVAEYMTAIQRDVLLLATKDVGSVSPTDPHPALLAERNRVVEVVNSRDPAQIDDAQTDELVATGCLLDKLVIDMPASSKAGIIAKLLVLAQMVAEGNEPEHAWWIAVITEAQAMTGMGSVANAFDFAAANEQAPGSAIHPDAALLDGYAALRHEMQLFLDATEDRVDLHRGSVFATIDEDEAAERRIVSLEEIVCGARPRTVEGAVAKLRVVMQHTAEDAWVNHATVDPAHRDFVTGLTKASSNERMLWSTITDLANIAGINLSEQGR